MGNCQQSPSNPEGIVKMKEQAHQVKVAKVVVFGESGAGKTSFIKRLKTGKWDDSVETTIGGGSSHIMTSHDLDSGFTGVPFKIEIQDSAGQEKYRSLWIPYAEHCDVVIYCVDATRINSLNFEGILKTAADFLGSMKDKRKVIITLTKKDEWEKLPDFFQKSTYEILDVIYEQLMPLGARRTFLSAKSNDQIDSFKMELVNILYDHAGIREVPESKLFNAIMLGNVGVGKSSFVNCAKLGKSALDSSKTRVTIGVDCVHLDVLDGKGKPIAKLVLWDTAGQEKHNALTSNYFRSADIVFIVQDASLEGVKESAEEITKYMKLVQEKTERNPSINLIYMKSDLMKVPQFNAPYFTKNDPEKIQSFVFEKVIDLF